MQTVIQHPVEQALEISKSFNRHHACSANPAIACRYKTGILDTELLNKHLKGTSLDDCGVVGVQYAGMTQNFTLKRKEVVFTVTDSRGNDLGRFFASAFKSFAC